MRFSLSYWLLLTNKKQSCRCHGNGENFAALFARRSVKERRKEAQENWTEANKKSETQNTKKSKINKKPKQNGGPSREKKQRENGTSTEGFLSRFDVALNGPSSNVMSQRITPKRKTK